MSCQEFIKLVANLVLGVTRTFTRYRELELTGSQIHNNYVYCEFIFFCVLYTHLFDFVHGRALYGKTVI